MPTRTERTYQVTQVEMTLETSHADFTRAFESVLGRMPVESLSDLPSLSPQAARERPVRIQTSPRDCHRGPYR
jgi:hypothetical protein